MPGGSTPGVFHREETSAPGSPSPDVFRGGRGRWRATPAWVYSTTARWASGAPTRMFSKWGVWDPVRPDRMFSTAGRRRAAGVLNPDVFHGGVVGMGWADPDVFHRGRGWGQTGCFPRRAVAGMGGANPGVFHAARWVAGPQPGCFPRQAEGGQGAPARMFSTTAPWVAPGPQPGCFPRGSGWDLVGPTRMFSTAGRRRAGSPSPDVFHDSPVGAPEPQPGCFPRGEAGTWLGRRRMSSTAGGGGAKPDVFHGRPNTGSASATRMFSMRDKEGGMGRDGLGRKRGDGPQRGWDWSPKPGRNQGGKAGDGRFDLRLGRMLR